MKPLAVGLILFGLLALGGTLDGARRKFIEQPLWAEQNWRTILRGVIGWGVAGGVAIIAGIVGLLL